MNVVKADCLPQGHVDHLMKEPIRNGRILAALKSKRPVEYYLDPERPERGIVRVMRDLHPGVPPIGTFSTGDLKAQMEMALKDTKPGEERGWIAQTMEQADALAQAMEVNRRIGSLVYAYELVDLLPCGSARLLTMEDIPTIEDWDPRTAKFLAKEATVSKKFGVVESGVCVSCASVGPFHGPYWMVGNLQTRAEHRQKGYAKAVVGACVNYLLPMGKIPIYETYEPNTPSIRTAESCGLKLVAEYWMIDGKMK